ncbi:S8 family peptidase [Pseudoalteromonas xiamenensis]|uniref:S8 family serine peptidase n=1 Tax=Pseudoalteromonas xiamenensis TaxID=882626 RepID=A0A975HK50_9GAMM|nr:S8 family peptidase [Pseudoalteromonas xiamenensis]QTH70661.1 S8 family serine peptidase [Pseudoalteromonas xiamenensis]
MITAKQLKLGALSLAIAATFQAPAIAATMTVNDIAAKVAAQPTRGTQFIIKYKSAKAGDFSTQNAADMNARAKQFIDGFASSKAHAKAKYVRSMALQNHHVVQAGKKLSPEEAQAFMDEMVATGNVEYIEIDQMLKPFATPNDPRYSDQWHYHEATGGLNLPSAWDKSTGAGVVVAVLDTGYRPHADLNANILPGYDMISDTFVANDGGGRDSDAKDPGDAIAKNECGDVHDAQDSSWHGTHVAGTIAAVTNNNEGVAGVAYDAKVVPVRVLGKCGGLTSDIADGIVWASGGSVSGVPANANPASVINMSLGGSGACSSATQSAINTARANGTVIVIAAGNDNDNANNYNPGNCSGVVNVASVGRNGGRAYYSNYGTSIDVAAPGGAQSFANDPQGILSTHNGGSSSPSTDTYHYMQGTSMAAPHVAGVAALIKQAKPSATPDEIESILKTTTRSFPATCNNCGTGIVDANAAVLKAIGGPITNELQDGVAATNLSGSKGSQTKYTYNVVSGASKVTFTMSGGTGDADMYVRAGTEPTTSVFDCRPYETGNNEVCTINNPTSGTYHVMLNGYAAYNGVSLLAQTTGGTTTTPTGSESTVTDISASSGTWKYYTVDVPAGMSSLTVTTSGGSGDADMYVKFGAQPTTSSFDCRPYENGNAETCNITSPSAGTYYIGLNAYKTFSGVTLNVKYVP